MGNAGERVNWRVARDASMRRVVQRGNALAPAELAHSVHVELNGLEAGRDYFYQSDTGNAESPIDHFRIAPAARDAMRELRFAFVTCQDWRVLAGEASSRPRERQHRILRALHCSGSARSCCSS